MDPYVQLICKPLNLDWKSQTCKSGSKKPSWDCNNKIEINVVNIDETLKIKLFDSDKIGKDVLIALVKPTFKELAKSNGSRDIEVEHDGKSAGLLHIKTHWTSLIDHKKSIEEEEQRRHQLSDQVANLEKSKEEFINSEIQFSQEQELHKVAMNEKEVAFKAHLAAERARLDEEERKFNAEAQAESEKMEQEASQFEA